MTNLIVQFESLYTVPHTLEDGRTFTFMPVGKDKVIGHIFIKQKDGKMVAAEYMSVQKEGKLYLTFQQEEFLFVITQEGFNLLRGSEIAYSFKVASE
jgi:hypothetical protein